jgi:hypothetical protein
VLNRYLVPRLFELNDWKLDDLPRFEPSDVDPPDLTQLSSFMTAMGSAGVQWFPDPELEKFLRQAARLPELDEDQIMVRETEERQSFVQRLAQQRLEMINLQAQAQGAAQQMVGGQMDMEDRAAAREQGDDPMARAQAEQQLAQNDEKHQMGLAGAKQKMDQSDQMHRIKMAQAKQAQKKAPAKPPTKGGAK